MNRLALAHLFNKPTSLLPVLLIVVIAGQTVALVSLHNTVQKQTSLLIKQNESLTQINKLGNGLQDATQSLSQINALKNEVQILAQQENGNNTILEQMQSANRLLNKNPSQTVSDVLGTMDASPSALNSSASQTSGKPAPLGLVQVGKQGSGKIVYTNPDQTQTIEVAQPDTVMLFYEKKDDWYQVDPPTHFGQLGWVQKNNLIEMRN